MRGRASAQVPQAGGIAFQARSTVRRGRLCGYAAGGRDAQKPGCRQEMFHYASMSHRLRKSRSLGPGRPPRTACPIQTRIKKRRTADKVTCRPRSPALASFSSRTGGRYDGSGGPAGFNRRRRERCGEEEEALSDPTLITCADRARRDKWAYNAKRRARDRRQSGDSRPARSRRRSRFFSSFFLVGSFRRAGDGKKGTGRVEQLRTWTPNCSSTTGTCGPRVVEIGDRGRSLDSG